VIPFGGKCEKILKIIVERWLYVNWYFHMVWMTNVGLNDFQIFNLSKSNFIDYLNIDNVIEHIMTKAEQQQMKLAEAGTWDMPWNWLYVCVWRIAWIEQEP